MQGQTTPDESAGSTNGLGVLALLCSLMLWLLVPQWWDAVMRMPTNFSTLAYFTPPLVGALPLILLLLLARRWGQALYMVALLPLAETANYFIVIAAGNVLGYRDRSDLAFLAAASAVLSCAWLALGILRYQLVIAPQYKPPRPVKYALKAASFVRIFFILLVLGIVFVNIVSSPGDGYSVRSRVSEFILAGSSAKTALSEGMQTYGSWSPDWMKAITISTTGMVASATIGPTGQIIVYGNAHTSGSVVTMTPTITTDNKLLWSCTGTPVKYMPASCR